MLFASASFGSFAMSEPSALLAALAAQLPVRLESYALSGRTAGLAIIHEENGFCTVGAGNLAPREPDAQIGRMIAETDRLARGFAEAKRPILAFLDTHEPDRPEPPYPPHCIRGSGEEDHVPELAWLDDCSHVTNLRTGCINCYVGATEPSYLGGGHGQFHNKVVDWVNAHRLDSIVTCGIGTDVAVLDFVATMLSVRNHGFTPTLEDVVVYEPGCATYDLPLDATAALGLPPTAAHPQAPTHHIGLYVMAGRGAVLANALI
jgi:nicotinamidase-related amidase